MENHVFHDHSINTRKHCSANPRGCVKIIMQRCIRHDMLYLEGEHRSAHDRGRAVVAHEARARHAWPIIDTRACVYMHVCTSHGICAENG